MKYSVTRPQALNVAGNPASAPFFGGDQAWYAEEWHRRAGCGPTCAANVTAYLAATHPELEALYAGDTMDQAAFANHMEALYTFVTPGNMGLNRPEMYTDGVEAFAASRGIPLKSHLFETAGYACRERPSVQELAAFVREGLSADCPVAFLNLSKGRVKNLQGWHWITITAAEMDDNQLFAWASDEGKEIRFDLKLWYLSTRMRGGLVYFTRP